MKKRLLRSRRIKALALPIMIKIYRDSYKNKFACTSKKSIMKLLDKPFLHHHYLIVNVKSGNGFKTLSFKRYRQIFNATCNLIPEKMLPEVGEARWCPVYSWVHLDSLMRPVEYGRVNTNE